jgi:prepilin-type N-terminal cleavage/methylation domain-containing protein
VNNLQRRHPSSAGFTLIEVIIVIAILAIMAGAMAPLAVRMIDSRRQDATLERQKSIYRSILGDPSAPGSGFVSDIGRLPSANLTDLAVAGTLPTYSLQPCGVGMGWRGPYLLEGVDAIGQPLDGWGTPMVLIGGQIISAGPDRIMSTTADNLVYPPTPITANNVNGSIALEVFALDSSTAQPVFVPAGGQATIYYAAGGLMRSLSVASLSGSYVFPASGASLSQGIHAISITADPDGMGPQLAVTRTVTIYCPGGGTAHQMVALR